METKTVKITMDAGFGTPMMVVKLMDGDWERGASSFRMEDGEKMSEYIQNYLTTGRAF